MRAISQDTYGEVEVLQLGDLPRPTITATEVLVEVAAAGLDRGTWHVMRGKPYLARLALGLRRPRARVPGLDLAGTIAEVGAEVTGWAVGDDVYGIGRGSFAEYAVADPAKLSRRPAGLSDEEAAVVPVSGLTAWQAVTRAGRVQAGQRVLVTGASGGVGTYAVQVAAALGAEVTGVCSASKAELVRSLGATHVLDYAADDVLAHGPYDVIIDIAGNPSNKRLRRALTPRGRAVIVGGETGGALAGGLGRPIRGVTRVRRPPAEDRDVPVQGDRRRPGPDHRADRVRPGHAVRRHRVPAREGRGRDVAPRLGTDARQDRDRGRRGARLTPDTPPRCPGPAAES